jgi:hypothetical protein
LGGSLFTAAVAPLLVSIFLLVCIHGSPVLNLYCLNLAKRRFIARKQRFQAC